MGWPYVGPAYNGWPTYWLAGGKLMGASFKKIHQVLVKPCLNLYEEKSRKASRWPRSMFGQTTNRCEWLMIPPIESK